jgi:hypothetical protein
MFRVLRHGSTRLDGTRRVMIAAALRRDLPSFRVLDCPAKIHPHTPTIPVPVWQYERRFHTRVKLKLLTVFLVITRAPRYAHHGLYRRPRGFCQYQKILSSWPIPACGSDQQHEAGIFCFGCLTGDFFARKR